MVLVDESPAARAAVREAWKLARGLRGDLLVAYFVKQLSEQGERDLARTLELAEDLNGKVRPLEHEGGIKQLSALLHAEQARHIVLVYRRPGAVERLLRRSVQDQILAANPGVRLHLVTRPTGE